MLGTPREKRVLVGACWLTSRWYLNRLALKGIAILIRNESIEWCMFDRISDVYMMQIISVEQRYLC